MDEKVLNELGNVKAAEIKLLTRHPTDLFKQRLIAYKSQYASKVIEAKIDVSKSFHDRYYIIDKEQIWNLGGSLNHAGDKSTTLFCISSEECRKKLILDYESAWERAEIIH